MSAEVVYLRPDNPPVSNWREDARNFGAWHRGGSWAAGLLVARNVEPGMGEGRPPKTSKNYEVSNRVSLAQFGREAGVSDMTVAAYLRAWELAADGGLVDHAAELEPDSDYDWDAETFTHERWVSYYRKQVKPKPSVDNDDDSETDYDEPTTELPQENTTESSQENEDEQEYQPFNWDRTFRSFKEIGRFLTKSPTAEQSKELARYLTKLLRKVEQ